MKPKILFNKETLFIIPLFLFACIINQYYGNRGIFPVDSFSHFDTGFRIILGEYPFKDYWIVSGPFVDYLQSLFFYFFGINWQIYILHASVINGILTIVTFVVLRNFNLNILYSFIYSLLFSVLAYTSSGTPFVDHHSSFFSLLGIYFLILAIKNNKTLYWYLIPIFFVFAFLSKQVPASYIIIVSVMILIYYSFVKKNYKCIQHFLLSTVLIIFSLLIFGKFQGISLDAFFEQYIFYPQTIGQNRFDNFNINFNNLVGHFKFIYIGFVPLIYVNLKNFFTKKNYFKEKDFIYFLILIGFTFCLIFHQLLTRNQTFIFFLVPILIAFSHISLKTNKKIISTVLILLCLFVSFKYHLRFNENRKFHELNYSDFKLSLSGKKIDKKFSGLNWITPEFRNNPEEEINLINEVKILLKNDSRTKMIMTNYSFFSAILGQSTFSTTRWHLFNGTDYPQKNSKYFESYKNLLINSIKLKKIEVIYTINPVNSSNIYDYIDKDCFQEKKITRILSSYELKNCKEISK